MAWQVAAFLGPIVFTLVVWGLDAFSGRKTTINAGLVTIVAGMELVDFSFLPVDIAAALMPGFAVAALLSNTLLTKREATDV